MDARLVHANRHLWLKDVRVGRHAPWMGVALVYVRMTDSLAQKILSHRNALLAPTCYAVCFAHSETKLMQSDALYAPVNPTPSLLCVPAELLVHLLVAQRECALKMIERARMSRWMLERNFVMWNMNVRF